MHEAFVLTSASFYGTLAAARCLGERGVPIWIAGSWPLAPSLWSRHVTRKFQCPDSDHPEKFVRWLIELGQEFPGQVLYPSSDELAWLFGLHSEELSTHFKLYQPSHEVLYRLLDKRTLYQAAESHGLEVPRTWYPEGPEDLASISREARLPVLIKPRTQLFLRSHSKGEYLPTTAHLVRRYQRFLENNTYGKAILGRHPEIDRPMVQTFHGQDADQVYSVSGFIDQSGDLFVARAARKVLQRPRRIGIGVCFEGVPLDPGAAEGVRNLCRGVGYFGLFEVEFLRLKDRFLLIDFNPRFYHQMAFDIARGMPLPYFVYLAALGDEDGLRRSFAESIDFRDAGHPAAFCNRFGLAMLMKTRSLGGHTTVAEQQHWREWLARNGANMVDAASRKDDRLPGIVDTINQTFSMVRHPHAYLHNAWLD